MSDNNIFVHYLGKNELGLDRIRPALLKADDRMSHDGEGPEHLIIEGENLNTLVSLQAGSYGLRNKVDLILWDPPYNTGNDDFCYADDQYKTAKEVQVLKNQGFVGEKDASRHTKWLCFMEVRLKLAKKLMKESGVIAICISYQELFRLGLLMDEIFGEKNRLGIINWECAYSPKNDNKGVPSTTDYILAYGKNKEKAFRGIIPRTEQMEARYKNPDGDKMPWSSSDFSAASGTDAYRYGIENPFTGELHFPPDGSFWRHPVETTREILCRWGVTYETNAEGNCVVKKGEDRGKAEAIRKNGPWPELYFLGKDGHGRPRKKRYRERIKNEGRVVGTYWEYEELADETWGTDQELALALRHQQSGHNDGAKKMLKAILGKNCTFETPKPLRLMERCIQMFCPSNGLVLDAFAGSGTTGHAVLNLNAAGAKRRFILIEAGGTNRNICREITKERIKRVITGKWATGDHDPLSGRFTYIKHSGQISRKAILEAQRHDLADIILQAHADVSKRDVHIENNRFSYIIGKTGKNEAIALVWDGERSALTSDNLEKIKAEATEAGLQRPIAVYACVNEGPSGSPSYRFFQIPDAILASLGVTGSEDI